MQEKTYETGSAPSLPSGTRREILELLLREALSAAEIAERLEVTPTAVRQHLAPLLALELVERRKDAPTTGRPTWRYRLSAVGRRAFPKRHDLLLAGIVEALIERRGTEGVLEIVEDAARRLARRAEGRFADLDRAARWDALLAWLEEEFEWESGVEAASGGKRIVLHHCPFQAVSLEHPAICGRFFSTLLAALADAAGVEHVPIRDGLRCCALEVREA